MQRASRNPATPPHTPETQHTPLPHALFAGTSGWAYTSWKPGFYPPTVSARAFLPCYASRLNSVEVNYTFRTLPTPEMMRSWLAAVPAGFRFSFKAPQRITHIQRLRDSGDALQAFADAIEPARKAGKLGPLLFQLPPNCKADLDRLHTFLRLPVFRRRKLRIAFEFRHESWFHDDIYAALRARNAALCVAEGDALVTPDVTTADFHCFRLRKAGGYTPAQLRSLARRLTARQATGHVFAYFRHEDQPTGALNAVSLLRQATAIAATAAKETR